MIRSEQNLTVIWNDIIYVYATNIESPLIMITLMIRRLTTFSYLHFKFVHLNIPA